MAEESLPEGFPSTVQLPLVWVAPEEQVIQLANQFLLQFDQTTFYLSAGQVAPPAFLGTPEERLEQAQALQFLPVRTIGRYSLARKTAEELRDLLDRLIKSFDEQSQEAKPE